jgi:probable addiction module antidote protein
MPTEKYQDLLIESLKNPEEAIAYLNAILEEFSADDEESQELLLIGLKNVVQAQGGVAKLSEKTGLGRESLYKTLSSNGNPKLSTLTSIAHGLGFDLEFSLSKKS